MLLEVAGSPVGGLVTGEFQRHHQQGDPDAEAYGSGDPPASAGSGLTLTYSPAVTAGAVGGETWSNQPSFSSMMNSTVLAHTSGLASNAVNT